MGYVIRRQSVRCRDLTIGNPSPVQGGVETVAAPAEVCLHGNGAKSGIDADKEQSQLWPDEIRKRLTAVGVEFRPGEAPSGRIRYTATVPARRLRPEFAREILVDESTFRGNPFC